MGDDQAEADGVRDLGLPSDDQHADPGLAGSPQMQISAGQVTEIAREIVTQMAPDELVFFGEASDAWLSTGRRRDKRKRTPGSSAGFGVEAVLLSELIFPIITGALGNVLGSAAIERMHRKPREAQPAHEAPSRPSRHGRSGDGSGRKMTRQQARALRDACEHHAVTAGLTAENAEMLADAFLGALGSRGWL
jgi:hypothetical protein